MGEVHTWPTQYQEAMLSEKPWVWNTRAKMLFFFVGNGLPPTKMQEWLSLSGHVKALDVQYFMHDFELLASQEAACKGKWYYDLITRQTCCLDVPGKPWHDKRLT